MRSRLCLVGLALGISLVTPERAAAQVGALGEIIKEKLDKSAETVAAAGQSGESGKPPATQVRTQSRAGGAASETINPVVLPISIDILDRLAAGLAAEAAERDKPAKRERCIARASQIHSIASLPPAEGAHALIQRCGPLIIVTDPAHYAEVGALGGGFSPEQYASLKQRVAPWCESSGSGSEPAAGSLFAETERMALKARCRILLPSFHKIAQ